MAMDPVEHPPHHPPHRQQLRRAEVMHCPLAARGRILREYDRPLSREARMVCWCGKKMYLCLLKSEVKCCESSFQSLLVIWNVVLAPHGRTCAVSRHPRHRLSLLICLQSHYVVVYLYTWLLALCPQLSIMVYELMICSDIETSSNLSSALQWLLKKRVLP